jgi:hypothetical protein
VAETLGFMFVRLRWWTVDALTGLLDGPRAKGAFMLIAVLRVWFARPGASAPGW